MHTKGLQGGPEHSSVDAVVCFAEIDKGGVKGFFILLVLVEKVLDDEGIVRGAAAGSETRLTLCSVVVELCPPIEAAEEGEGVELRNGRANCDAAVVIEDVGLSLRLRDRGQGKESGEGVRGDKGGRVIGVKEVVEVVCPVVCGDGGGAGARVLAKL